MLVISTRKFREKQGEYLGMVANGVDVVLKSRKEGSFKIVPVSDDDTLMSKEAFFAKIDRSLQEAKEGKVFTMLPNESLTEFLTRTENV
jgi:antitoxin (DNA-binding transcriptional repressor) of toxin-antitoxin stability system